MRINYSRINTYQACQRLYYWRFIANLEPDKYALPLIVGRAVHAGLAAHYASKPMFEAASASFQEVRDMPGATWFAPELEELATHERYVHYILNEYARVYLKEPFTVLAPETKGAVPIEDSKHTLVFTADAIINLQGRPWLLEHKTSGQLGATFFQKFEMDGQVTCYDYGVWKAIDARPVGAIINAIFKSRKLDRTDFARHPVMRSESFVVQFMKELIPLISEIEEKAMKNARDWFFMNTSSCVLFNRKCPYLELCTTPPETELPIELFRHREPDYTEVNDDVWPCQSQGGSHEQDDDG